ncbi:uncharacterized protein AAEQ78_025040 [Lycaon pictus]
MREGWKGTGSPTWCRRAEGQSKQPRRRGGRKATPIKTFTNEAAGADSRRPPTRDSPRSAAAPRRGSGARRPRGCPRDRPLPGAPASRRARRRGTPAPAHSPRPREGPPPGQLLNLPPHPFCCCHPRLRIGAPLRVPSTPGTPPPAAPLVQSNPASGHQPALPEPMAAALLPPRRRASANQEGPCCGVPGAIATGDACRGVAVATAERAASGPKAASPGGGRWAVGPCLGRLPRTWGLPGPLPPTWGHRAGSPAPGAAGPAPSDLGPPGRLTRTWSRRAGSLGPGATGPAHPHLEPPGRLSPTWATRPAPSDLGLPGQLTPTWGY